MLIKSLFFVLIFELLTSKKMTHETFEKQTIVDLSEDLIVKYIKQNEEIYFPKTIYSIRHFQGKHNVDPTYSYIRSRFNRIWF